MLGFYRDTREAQHCAWHRKALHQHLLNERMNGVDTNHRRVNGQRNTAAFRLRTGRDLKQTHPVLNKQIISTATKNHNYNFSMIWKKIRITEEDKNQVLNFMDT